MSAFHTLACNDVGQVDAARKSNRSFFTASSAYSLACSAVNKIDISKMEFLNLSGQKSYTPIKLIYVS